MAAEPIYRGAATIVTTAVERDKLYEWIRRNAREYEEEQLDSGRTFVVVFSGNKAQLEEAQAAFSYIQKGSECIE
jgi:hypothetical protein